LVVCFAPLQLSTCAALRNDVWHRGFFKHLLDDDDIRTRAVIYTFLAHYHKTALFSSFQPQPIVHKAALFVDVDS
jgi:hypothetical protein